MAKRKRSEDGSRLADSDAYTVFMDSNLDTHLAMIVSAQDTIRDLKEKIMIEHPHCFPNIGEIIVNALKVKRRGCFYLLSDSMLVKSVFNGFMKTWFLHFDAIRQGEHKENLYHLEPRTSDLPSHVFTMDGPLPETNTLLLDLPSKDVSILAVPSVPQAGNSQPRGMFPQNSSNADFEGLSTRLLEDDHLIPKNSSDDKQKPKNADSEGLYENGPLLGSGNKKKKKKNKPSVPHDQVDNAIPSGKNVREDTYDVALESNHVNLGEEFATALASVKTDGAHPFVDDNMHKPGMTNVERKETSDHIEASRGRKSKGSKKRQATSVKGLDLPMVAVPGNLTKDTPTLVYENVCFDNNVGDDARGEISEVALGNNHGNLGGEFDAVLASGKTDGADTFVDDNMHKFGTSNVERKDTSDHIEASKRKKSKGSKKRQATSVKGRDLPVVAEPGNLTKDTTTLVYENVCFDNNVGDDARGESSEVALGNNHGNLGGEFDAALASVKTDGAYPFVDDNMHKPGTSNVERKDTSDHIEASRGRKSKGSKKRQATSVKGLDLPVVAEPGSLTKDTTTLVYENVCFDNNVGDDARGETSEVALGKNHGNLRGEFDAALASGKTDGVDTFVDENMHKLSMSNVERKDTSDHIEASKRKKSKGSKKRQATSVKGLDLPVVTEPGNLTKDTTTLVYENVCFDNNVGDDARGETSEVALGKTHGNLRGEFDAPLASGKTDGVDTFVDDNMHKPGTSKVERRDTSDHIEASGGRKSKRSKKHQAASVEGLEMPVVFEPGNLRKESTTLVHENFRFDKSDGGGDETGKTEKEKKSLLQDEDPKPTMSASPDSELKYLGLDEAETNSKFGIIFSKLIQSSDSSRTGDSGNKRRNKSKKSKDSDRKGQTSSSGIEDANVVGGAIPLKPELDKASFSDHCGDETIEKHNTLSLNEKAKVSEVKVVNTPVTGPDKEADNACGNPVDLVPPIQVTKIQKAVEGSDYKVKRKSKKSETSAKSLQDPKAEKQDVVTIDPALPFDKKKRKTIQSNNKKKTRLGKKAPTEQLMDSMSEAEKDIGSRIICSKPCSISGTNEPPEVPSDIFACNTERPPHEADIRDDILSSGFSDIGNDHIEVPKFESAKISYIDSFGPSQKQHEVAPGRELDVKDIQMERSDKELPSIKKTKKHNLRSLGTLPGLQKSLNSNDEGFNEKPQDDSFVVEVQVPISKTKKDEAMANTHNRKTSTTTGNRVKDPTSHFQEKCDSIAHEASKTKIVDASGISSPVHSSEFRVPFRAGGNAFVKENSEDWDASGFASESPDVVHKNIQGRELKSRSKFNPVAAVKDSSKKIGKVFNNYSHQKSLFVTSGTIFKDSSSDGSEDEGEISNSETSTKSPLDSSSSASSDYLERTNHSPRNASYGGKRKEKGGGSLIYSQSGSPTDIPLDMILRSSRSYKKAKLTASQSQLEETESQPIDFVLDSLADP